MQGLKRVQLERDYNSSLRWTDRATTELPRARAERDCVRSGYGRTSSFGFMSALNKRRHNDNVIL
ncbi:hypothetical protein J6590_086077 [Homalodisca vitripennis]|nr:hypothetical protein J6590_086077 [Homalodisca vitripennis]